MIISYCPASDFREWFWDVRICEMVRLAFGE